MTFINLIIVLSILCIYFLILGGYFYGKSNEVVEQTKRYDDYSDC